MNSIFHEKLICDISFLNVSKLCTALWLCIDESITFHSGSRGKVSSDTSVATIPSSDIYEGIRNILKLPPGLCLVKCDTLREGQTPLSEDQVRDWYDRVRPAISGSEGDKII